jgi:hypothetical protein
MDTIPPPERVARARRLYADGVKFATILAETQMTKAQLLRCLAGDFDDGSVAKPAPIALRSAFKGKCGSKRPRETDREALIERIWNAATRQVKEIEARIAAAGLEISEQEGNARTLAIVVKTLRELKALEERTPARARKAADDDDDRSIPRDIDELRRSLARKIDAIIAERGTDAPEAGI